MREEYNVEEMEVLDEISKVDIKNLIEIGAIDFRRYMMFIIEEKAIGNLVVPKYDGTESTYSYEKINDIYKENGKTISREDFFKNIFGSFENEESLREFINSKALELTQKREDTGEVISLNEKPSEFFEEVDRLELDEDFRLSTFHKHGILKIPAGKGDKRYLVIPSFLVARTQFDDEKHLSKDITFPEPSCILIEIDNDGVFKLNEKGFLNAHATSLDNLEILIKLHNLEATSEEDKFALVENTPLFDIFEDYLRINRANSGDSIPLEGKSLKVGSISFSQKKDGEYVFQIDEKEVKHETFLNNLYPVLINKDLNEEYFSEPYEIKPFDLYKNYVVVRESSKVFLKEEYHRMVENYVEKVLSSREKFEEDYNVIIKDEDESILKMRNDFYNSRLEDKISPEALLTSLKFRQNGEGVIDEYVKTLYTLMNSNSKEDIFESIDSFYSKMNSIDLKKFEEDKSSNFSFVLDKSLYKECTYSSEKSEDGKTYLEVFLKDFYKQSLEQILRHNLIEASWSNDEIEKAIKEDDNSEEIDLENLLWFIAKSQYTREEDFLDRNVMIREVDGKVMFDEYLNNVSKQLFEIVTLMGDQQAFWEGYKDYLPNHDLVNDCFMKNIKFKALDDRAVEFDEETKEQRVEIIRGYIVSELNLPGENEQLRKVQDFYHQMKNQYGDKNKANRCLEIALNSFSQDEIGKLYKENEKLLNCYFEAVSIPYKKMVEEMLDRLDYDDNLLRITAHNGHSIDIEYKTTLYGEPKYLVSTIDNKTGEKTPIVVKKDSQEISLFSKDSILEGILFNEKRVDESMQRRFVTEHINTYLRSKEGDIVSTLYEDSSIASSRNEENLPLNERILLALNRGETVVLTKPSNSIGNTELIAFYKEKESGKYFYKSMGTNQSNVSLAEVELRDTKDITYYAGGIKEFNVGTTSNPTLRLNVKTQEINFRDIEKKIEDVKNWNYETNNSLQISTKEKDTMGENKKFIRYYKQKNATSFDERIAYFLNERIKKNLDRNDEKDGYGDNIKFCSYGIDEKHKDGSSSRFYISFSQRQDENDGNLDANKSTFFDMDVVEVRTKPNGEFDGRASYHIKKALESNNGELSFSTNSNFAMNILELMSRNEEQMKNTKIIFFGERNEDLEKVRERDKATSHAIERFSTLSSYFRGIDSSLDSFFAQKEFKIEENIQGLERSTQVTFEEVDIQKVLVRFPNVRKALNCRLEDVRLESGKEKYTINDVVKEDLAFYKKMWDNLKSNVPVKDVYYNINTLGSEEKSNSIDAIEIIPAKEL